MSTASFRVVYDGPALKNHTMDVRQLAPALLALSDVLEIANDVINSQRSTVSVKVNASFKTGSFGIDLSVVQGIYDTVRDMFTTGSLADAKVLLEALGFWLGAPTAAVGGGLIWLIKRLNGRTISRVELYKDGTCEIHVDGEKIKVERKVIDLYQNWQLRKALENAVVKPLESDGVDSVAITNDKGEDFFRITRMESASFRAPDLPQTELETSEYVTNLQLVSVSFQEGNKWRFTDGENTFHAEMADPDFLAKVERNQAAFSKGDVLRSRVQSHQRIDGEKMKTDYRVVEVLEHRRAYRQIPLPIDRPK